MINTVMLVAFLAWPKTTYPFNHPHNVPSHTAFEINEIMDKEKKLLLHSSYTNISMYFDEKKAIHIKRRWA